MFENIFGHEKVISRLKNDIKTNSFPHSILLAGPSNLGKFNVALEIYRALNCKNDAGWKCECENCKKNRELTLTNFIVLGYKNFLPEIKIYSELLAKNNSKINILKFLRSVRKQLLYFNSNILTDKDIDKEVFETIKELEYNIAELKKNENAQYENIKDKIEAIVSFCQKLDAAVSNSKTSIDNIRKMIGFANTTSIYKKVFVINNVDELNLSATNALLKILEEPLESCYFILLSTSRTKIIQTILSRVRIYAFQSRSIENETKVIKKIFGFEDIQNISLRDFFYSWNNIDINFIREKVDKWIALLFNIKSKQSDEIALIAEEISSKNYYQNFLETITINLEKSFLSIEKCDSEKILLYRKLMEILANYKKIKIDFNQASENLLMGCFFEIQNLIFYGDFNG